MTTPALRDLPCDLRRLSGQTNRTSITTSTTIWASEEYVLAAAALCRCSGVLQPQEIEPGNSRKHLMDYDGTLLSPQAGPRDLLELGEVAYFEFVVAGNDDLMDLQTFILRRLPWHCVGLGLTRVE